MNFLFDALVIYVVVRVAWGAYRFLTAQKRSARGDKPRDKEARRPRGRFDTRGKNVQDAEFEEMQDKDK